MDPILRIALIQTHRLIGAILDYEPIGTHHREDLKAPRRTSRRKANQKVASPL